MAAARKRQTVRRALTDWEPPANYQPMPGLKAYLKSISPRMNTAEMDMVLYCDWRTRPVWRKTVEKAWRDLGMTPQHARDAFAKKIIFMEIFDKAVARAKDVRTEARLREMPSR